MKIESIDKLKEACVDQSVECYIEKDNSTPGKIYLQVWYNRHKGNFLITDITTGGRQIVPEDMLGKMTPIPIAITKGTFYLS